MRFALAPLQQAAGRPSHSDLAEMVGEKRATVAQWAQRGLNERQADRAAIAVGFHPAEVWADWWEVAAFPCGNDRCGELVMGHKFCSPRCRWAARQRERNHVLRPRSPQTTRETVAG